MGLIGFLLVAVIDVVAFFLCGLCFHTISINIAGGPVTTSFLEMFIAVGGFFFSGGVGIVILITLLALIFKGKISFSSP